MIQLFHRVKNYDLGRTYYRVTIAETTRTTDKKMSKIQQKQNTIHFSQKNFYDFCYIIWKY